MKYLLAFAIVATLATSGTYTFGFFFSLFLLFEFFSNYFGTELLKKIFLLFDSQLLQSSATFANL